MRALDNLPTEEATELDLGDDSGELGENANLASALRISVMRLSRRLRAEKSDDTLGLSQLSALATLSHGPLSPKALAERERVQPPSMTRVIAALEERGLVAREAHPNDRRQSVLVISNAGEELVVADRCRRQAWLAHILQELDDSDLEKLRAALPVLERICQV